MHAAYEMDYCCTQKVDGVRYIIIRPKCSTQYHNLYNHESLLSDLRQPTSSKSELLLSIKISWDYTVSEYMRIDAVVIIIGRSEIYAPCQSTSFHSQTADPSSLLCLRLKTRWLPATSGPHHCCDCAHAPHATMTSTDNDTTLADPIFEIHKSTGRASHLTCKIASSKPKFGVDIPRLGPAWLHLAADRS